MLAKYREWSQRQQQRTLAKNEAFRAQEAARQQEAWRQEYNRKYPQYAAYIQTIAHLPQVMKVYDKPEEFEQDAWWMTHFGWKVTTNSATSYRNMAAAAVGLAFAGPLGAMAGARRMGKIMVTYERAP